MDERTPALMAVDKCKRRAGDSYAGRYPEPFRQPLSQNGFTGGQIADERYDVARRCSYIAR